MAVALKIQSSRGDVFKVDPNDLIMQKEFRGREFPPTEADVIELASSMVKYGQEEPIMIRPVGKGDDTSYHVVFGFTRTEAAQLIRKGFIDPETGEFVQNEEFKLEDKVNKLDDKAAFEAACVENAHRHGTSDIDRAKSIRALMERYEYNAAQAARLLRLQRIQVSHLLRLLELPVDVQRLVHDRKMARQCALDWLQIPEEKRMDSLRSARQQNGSYSSLVMRQLLREHIGEKAPIEEFDGVEGSETDIIFGGAPASKTRTGKADKGGDGEPAPARRLPVTLSEFKKILEAEASDEGATEKSKAWASATLAFLTGDKKKPWWSKKMNEILG